MGQVTVSLNGRRFTLRCGDGEEQRLTELAQHVNQRIEQLASEFGQFGDDRLLLMATLLITDEMLDLRARLTLLEPADADLAAAGPLPTVEPDAGQPAQDGHANAGETASVHSQPPEVRPSKAEPVAASAPAAAAKTPAPKPPRRQPPARGSLEARLAEARAGPPLPAKPGAS